MYKISFFTPENAAESIKSSMFLAGAGKIGNYEQCSFQTLGTGQFKPIAGAAPFIGERDKLEYVSELKVEMICSPDCIGEVIAAMKKTHPYEMPAYDVIKLMDF